MNINIEKFKDNIKKELSFLLERKENEIDYSRSAFGDEFIIKNETDINVYVYIEREKMYGNSIYLSTGCVNEELLRHLKTLSEFINNDELLEDIKRKSISEVPSRVALMLEEKEG